MPDQPSDTDPQITTTHQLHPGLLTLIILSSMILGASIAALVLS